MAQLSEVSGGTLPEDARTGLSWWGAGQPHAVWSQFGWTAEPKLALDSVLFTRTLVIQPPSTYWKLYTAWNEAIGQEFYSGGNVGTPVYLDMDDEVISRIAPGDIDTVFGPAEQLVRAVTPTLDLSGVGGGVFRQHVDRLRAWDRAHDSEFPPVLALLAVFCLVAEGMRETEDFAGANYYGPLCKTFGVDRETPAGHALIKDFTKQSHLFWDSLNAWLLGQEGDRGMPTAFAFDHRRHVGRPISQALLRETDRERLGHLFTEYRLRPGQSMSLPDMVRLMKEWVPTSRLSVSAKTLWKKGQAAQDRMATVAIIELDAWKGPDERTTDDGPAEGRIRLIAQFRRMPRPRFDLGAIVRAGSRIPLGAYRRSSASIGPEAEALADVSGVLHLVRGPSDEWLGFQEAEAISMPDLLIANVRLSREGGTTLAREPRSLVILRMDESVGASIEIDHAEFGAALHLLVHTSLEDDLQGVLDSCVRPGFRRWISTELAGLPEGWLLFTNVQLVAPPPDDLKEDLRSLVPLSWTSVSFGGGFALPGIHTWHVAHPPEVRATAVTDDTSIGVKVTCLQAFDERVPSEAALGVFDGAGIYSLDGLSLPEGDYEVSLEVNPNSSAPKFLVRNTFRLRSGATYMPRLESSPWIGHTFKRPAWGLLSADRIEAPPGAYVRGAEVALKLPVPDDRDPPLPPSALAPGGGSDDVEEGSSPSSKARWETTPDCLLRGAHHWRLDAQIPGSHVRVHGYCKNCGLEKDWPGRPKLKRTFRRPSPNVVVEVVNAPPARPVRTAPALSAIGESGSIDADSLLDALSYVGSGTWASFDRLASQIDDSPWFPLEMAHTLSALGHIDIVIDGTTLRPTEWAIAPPVIAMVNELDAVMCGFRSEMFLDRVAEAAGILDGSVVIEATVPAPTVIRVRGLDRKELDELASYIDTLVPEVARVSVRPAAGLLGQAAPLMDVTVDLATFSPPERFTKRRFDPRTAKWVQRDHFDTPGGYQILGRPLRYGFMATSQVSDRRVHVADNRLVKYLAATEEGVAILGYDAAGERLLCYLGAQLPGLLERAAVLATGSPPVRLDDGTVEYAGVSRQLAAQIWGLLQPGTSERR